MTALAAALAGGLILGLAGSLHCACMCGGIASTSLLLLKPPSPEERVRALLSMQAARVMFYALTGGIVAASAGLTVGPNATAATYAALRWLSSAALIWIGLSLAGLVPQFVLPAVPSFMARVASRVTLAVRGNAGFAPLAMGLTWGMTPCPMVYSALIPATLTGSATCGAAFMLGFGLGTIPMVTATSLGITSLTRIRRLRHAEVAGGIAVAAFGLLSAVNPWPSLLLFCGRQ